MYLKDSKTVVIKIGSSLLINEKKIIRDKWLLEFSKDKLQIERHRKEQARKEFVSKIQLKNNRRLCRSTWS